MELSELEDSVASLSAPGEVGEEVIKPRKLGRLRKAGALENKPPNKTGAASPGQLGRQALQDGKTDEHGKSEDEGGRQDIGQAAAQAAAGDSSKAEAAPAAASPSHQAGGSEEAAAEDEDASRGGNEDYFDEEDELEEHLVRRNTQGHGAMSAEVSDDEDGGGSVVSGGSAGSQPGSPGTLELLANDTQRILRETAARDRLGRGHKIEIKPLSSILGRIKERQALAIARAPKPALPSVGTFDDILAEARQQAGGAVPAAVEHGDEPQAEGKAAGSADAQAAQDTAAPAAGQAAGGAEQPEGAAGEEDGDDLVIMDSDDDDSGAGGALGEVRLVELPSTTKKRRMPIITQENSYEDEILIDDGYNSEEEEEEDLGRRRSDDEEEEEEEGSVAAEEEEGSEMGGDAEGEEACGKRTEADQGDSPAAKTAMEDEEEEGQEEGVQHGNGRESSAAEDEEMEDGEGEPSDDLGEADAAPAVAAAVPKRQNKLQRLFLDMEAELSDEEGGAHSEDESEDLDEQGELAGLIGTAKETAKDRKLRQLLHRQWAEQQDDKELQQLMAGLKNGFRRRRGAGFLDDEDDEVAGRRRRARAGSDDEEDGAAGGLPWPSPFDAAAGSDDEAEDEELLRKAKEGLLLAEPEDDAEGGARPGGASSGPLTAVASGSSGIPLDEGSQEVLGLLLARSGSEPQQGGSSGTGRSRFAPGGGAGPLPTFGSDPSNSRLPGLAVGNQSRGPSFLGRQPTVQRGASSAGLGAGGRSFVFGRDDSQSMQVADKVGSGSEEAAGSIMEQGPTSFANLRQMAGMPGPSAQQQQQHRKRPGSSLVSRLKPPVHRAGKEPVGSQPADPAASAAAAAAAVAVMAGGGRRVAK